MKEIILYTEKECVDCVELKERLNSESIKFTNKDLMEESDDLTCKYPNKWEHTDLVRDYNLPQWVPTAVIKEGDKMKFVCSSTTEYAIRNSKDGGDIYLAENSELLFEKIKELL
jgi:hypothetical protein